MRFFYAGSINITTSLNAPALANPGNLGAEITSSSNLGIVTIKRGHQPQNMNGGKSIASYYDILPANNSNLNATLRFHYFYAEKNGLDESQFVLARSDNNVTWSDVGFTSKSAASNYVEKDGISDFSRWTLSESDIILPVHGLQLSGIWKNDASVLNWTTLTENNNHYFEMEQSIRIKRRKKRLVRGGQKIKNFIINGRRKACFRISA